MVLRKNLIIGLALFSSMSLVLSATFSNVALAKPDFELNSVGIQCAAQWNALDDHVREGRKKGYTNMTPAEYAAWQDEFRRLLNQWNSFCGKYYGNYIVPFKVPGVSVGGPSDGGILNEEDSPSFPGGEVGGPQDGGVIDKPAKGESKNKKEIGDILQNPKLVK